MELRGSWPRLLGLVTLGFLLQENVEALASGEQLSGLEPLFGLHPLAVPVLLGLTFIAAGLSSLVASHTRSLEALVARLRAALPRATAMVAHRTSRASAVSLRDSIRLRPEAGRAPPSSAVPISA
jgi:hypothetical protein